MTTYYDVLDVPTDAAADEIRDAYRERLKEAHPDLSDDDDASERTRRIVRARDVLTDEAERERYDRVGHAEYVGDGESDVDAADVSDAAAAARRAGWADTGSSGETASEGEEWSRTDGRRRARDRRRRERAAGERVANDASGSATSERGATDAASTEGGGSAGAAAATTAAGVGAGTASGSGSAWAWNRRDGFSVRREHDSGRRRRRPVPTRASLTLGATTFVLYPLLLFSALFPPFPLLVNAVVGLCTILVVGYLQSRPGVGVFVFGSWSLLIPAAFVSLGVPLTGLVGIAALSGTWLPFGLSTVTLLLVRP